MIALGHTGCLVTSSPDFTPRERTRPIIVSHDPYGPTPAVGEFTLFYSSSGDYTAERFSAYVESEDVGQDIQAFLLIDYGDESGVSNGPYRSYVPGEPLKSGSLSEGPRGPIDISWRPQKQETPGCHRVTLMVTHQFKQVEGEFWCPADPDDASTITWFAAICNTENPDDCSYDDCPVQGQATGTYCGGVALGEGGSSP